MRLISIRGADKLEETHEDDKAPAPIKPPKKTMVMDEIDITAKPPGMSTTEKWAAGIGGALLCIGIGKWLSS
jgi:hypothetical protein